MRKLLLSGLCLFCFSVSATAAEPLSRGFYVGGMGGVTEFDDDGLFDRQNFDDNSTSYSLFGGYKILKYLAVEVRLSDLGSYDVSNQFSSGDFDLKAVSTHVIGIIPFGASGWEIFGQLGIGYVNFDTDCCGDDDQAVGSAGVGVRFYPQPHWSISLQTDVYAYEEDDYYYDDYYYNNDYTLSVGVTQIGVQYLF